MEGCSREVIAGTSSLQITIARCAPRLGHRGAPALLHQVRMELGESRGAATIVERRAPWREDYGPEWTSRGIARFRYVAKDRLWTLYWSDRNQRWHRYDLIEPSADILVQLDEVDRDPTCIFWG